MKHIYTLLLLAVSTAFGQVAVNDINGLSQVTKATTPIASAPVRFAGESAITGTTASFRSAVGLGTEDSPTFTGLTLSGLTATRVPFVTTAGLLTDDADMTFATDTLTVTKATIGGISHIANAITSVNSLTSAAVSNLTLGTGTFGTFLTAASATGAVTFAADISLPTGTTTTQGVSFGSDVHLFRNYTSLTTVIQTDALLSAAGFTFNSNQAIAGLYTISSPAPYVTAFGSGNPVAETMRMTLGNNILIGGTIDPFGSGGNVKIFGSGGLIVSGTILGSGGTAPTSTTTGSNIFTAGIATSGPVFSGGSLTVSGTGTSSFAGPVTIATAKSLSFSSGTNQRAGNLTLVGGTLTVSNTTVTANTVVMLTRKTSGGTIGTAITYTLSAGTSFTVNSDNILDTSTFSYLLIEVP